MSCSYKLGTAHKSLTEYGQFSVDLLKSVGSTDIYLIYSYNKNKHLKHWVAPEKDIVCSLCVFYFIGLFCHQICDYVIHILSCYLQQVSVLH